MSRHPTEHVELPDHRHDVRVVREPHRAQAQQARRRDRHGQLRHREGAGRVRPGRGRPPSSSSAPSRPPATSAALPRRAGRGRRRAAERAGRDRAAAPARCSSPRCCRVPALAALDDPGAAVRQLAVAVAEARHARSCCGRAWPFHRAAWANLRHGAATMDTLVSARHARRLAVVAVRAVPRRRRHDRHADGLRASSRSPARAPTRSTSRSAGVVTTFLLAGRYFEARAKRRAGAALKALLELGAKDVAVLDADGTERRVPVEQLAVGDRFVVRPGEKVATDGVVEDGTLGGRLSRCSPASRSRSRSQPGDEVAGATVNAGGRLVVRATRVGADTALAQIARLVDRRPDRQGAGPAPRRPHLRASSSRSSSRSRSRRSAFWLGTGREHDVRLHRRGRRADHRLPVRARARDADGAAGRHRPRRPARACSSRARRSSSPPARSTRSCSTRPAP